MTETLLVQKVAYNHAVFSRRILVENVKPQQLRTSTT